MKRNKILLIALLSFLLIFLGTWKYNEFNTKADEEWPRTSPPIGQES